MSYTKSDTLLFPAVEEAVQERIKKIFATILEEQSNLIKRIKAQNLDIEAFKKALLDYQWALIDELKLHLNHSIDAAIALEKLENSSSEDNFLNNLILFNQIAMDSKLHPRATQASIILFRLLVPLLCAAIILTMAFSALPLFVTGVGACVIALFALYLLQGLTLKHLYEPNHFQAVYAAKAKGKVLGLFFQPKETQERIDIKTKEIEKSPDLLDKVTNFILL